MLHDEGVYQGDDHRLSATIEVVDSHETVVATGRFAAGQGRPRRDAKACRRLADRIWAVEGRKRTGRPRHNGCWLMKSLWRMCQPSSRRGRGCSTTATTARPTPMTRTRSRSSRSAPGTKGACSRRRAGGDAPDGRTARGARSSSGTDGQSAPAVAVGADPRVSKKDITASQAKGFLASVRPCDVAGRTWRRTAVEHLTLLVTLDKKVRPSTEELKFSALLRPGDPQVRSPTWVDGPSQELYIDPDPQAAAHQHDRLAAILQVTWFTALATSRPSEGLRRCRRSWSDPQLVFDDMPNSDIAGASRAGEADIRGYQTQVDEPPGSDGDSGVSRVPRRLDVWILVPGTRRNRWDGGLPGRASTQGPRSARGQQERCQHRARPRDQ